MIGTPSLKASYQPTINKAQKTVHDERLAFHKKGFCPHHNDVKIVKGGIMKKKHIGCWKCDKLFEIEVQNSSNPIGSVITVPETQMPFVDERSISNASPIVDVPVNSELKKLKNDLELTRKALEAQKGKNSIDHELSQVAQVALKGKNDEIIKLKNDLELTRKALEAQKGKNSIDHELSQVAQVAQKGKNDEIIKLKNDLELTRKALEAQKGKNSIDHELSHKAFEVEKEKTTNSKLKIEMLSYIGKKIEKPMLNPVTKRKGIFIGTIREIVSSSGNIDLQKEFIVSFKTHEESISLFEIRSLMGLKFLNFIRH